MRCSIYDEAEQHTSVMRLERLPVPITAAGIIKGIVDEFDDSSERFSVGPFYGNSLNMISF